MPPINKKEELRKEWLVQVAPFNRNSDEDTANWWLSKLSQQKSDILKVIEGKKLIQDKESMYGNGHFWTNIKEKILGYNQALDELYKEIEKI